MACYIFCIYTSDAGDVLYASFKQKLEECIKEKKKYIYDGSLGMHNFYLERMQKKSIFY